MTKNTATRRSRGHSLTIMRGSRTEEVTTSMVHQWYQWDQYAHEHLSDCGYSIIDHELGLGFRQWHVKNYKRCDITQLCSPYWKSILLAIKHKYSDEWMTRID